MALKDTREGRAIARLFEDRDGPGGETCVCCGTPLGPEDTTCFDLRTGEIRCMNCEGLPAKEAGR